MSSPLTSEEATMETGEPEMTANAADDADAAAGLMMTAMGEATEPASTFTSTTTNIVAVTNMHNNNYDQEEEEEEDEDDEDDEMEEGELRADQEGNTHQDFNKEKEDYTQHYHHDNDNVYEERTIREEEIEGNDEEEALIEENNKRSDRAGAETALGENMEAEEQNNSMTISNENELQLQQQHDLSASAFANASGIYSTRGRSVADLQEALERIETEPLREKEPTPRETFLNDSVTEEERRTRTRYIPQVEGMHALRKPEVKGDIALARTSFASAGVAGSVAAAKSKSKRSNNSNIKSDMMDVDEAVGNVEDDRATEILKVGTMSLDIESTRLIVPSTAFIAPVVGDTDKEQSVKTPREVESISAFDPPRPPESIGAKKKHRMLRWERSPTDIEVDLKNYRKTVVRTRQELKKAEAERDRIETVEYHMRKHFLCYLQCMNEERKRLNEELGIVQQECIKAADLLTSRTRSRVAGKSNCAMKEVLSVLRSRGQEIESKNLSYNEGSLLFFSEDQRPGVGGVGAMSLQDWDRHSEIKPADLASAWILPGDEVKSPYGDGRVISFTESELSDVLAFKDQSKLQNLENDNEGHEVSKRNSSTEDNSGYDYACDNGGQKQVQKSRKAPKGSLSAMTKEKTHYSVTSPRICVQLSYGVGYFNVASVVPKERLSTYSDARLALRWKGLAETAAAMGSVVDIEAMARRSELLSKADNMEIDEGVAEKFSNNDKKRKRVLPFGAGMLPTGGARGATLINLNQNDFDREMDVVLNGKGILGRKNNIGVTREIRKNEDVMQERFKLKARALQLRNELSRQRRVRLLNERTHAAFQERSLRVEQLVVEMRTDLKTLKIRLDHEIKELGMSEKQVESILSSFYRSFDSRHSGEASPPKRPRKMSHPDADEDDDNLDGVHGLNATEL